MTKIVGPASVPEWAQILAPAANDVCILVKRIAELHDVPYDAALRAIVALRRHPDRLMRKLNDAEKATRVWHADGPSTPDEASVSELADDMAKLCGVSEDKAARVIAGLRSIFDVFMDLLAGVRLRDFINWCTYDLKVNIFPEILSVFFENGGINQRFLRQKGVGNDTNTAARHPRHPLPELPAGLHWPVDFDKTPEFGKPNGIISYLDREWKAIIAAEKIDMRQLREHFPKAAEAINNYTKPKPKTGEKRKLSHELTIPVIDEVNTRELARVLSGQEVVNPKDARRLGAALGRRMAKGQMPEPR